MTNPVITNNSTNDVAMFDVRFRKGTFEATGAGTVAAGTILARDSASLNYIPYVKGGSTNDNGIPKAILRTALTTTGAGNYSINPIIGGQVRDSKLVIAADGDNSNVDATVRDELQDYGIEVYLTEQLAAFDNQ